MNLTDYPTPRTEAETWRAGDLRIGARVSADFARQLEREAAAWKKVAEAIHSAYNLDELQAAHEAFDDLKAELEQP